MDGGFDKTAARETLRAAKEKAKLRNAFKCFDVDNSGTLSADEFLKLLTHSSASSGSNGLTIEDAQEILKGCDKNGDGILQLDELCEGWDSVNNNEATKAAQEKRMADAVLYDEIMTLESEYLEKHCKMLTDLAAVVRTDATIDREIDLIDKMQTTYETRSKCPPPLYSLR